MSLAETSNILKRAGHARQQWGTIGMMRRGAARLWNHLVHNRHHIFRHSGSSIALKANAQLSIARYDTLDAVPEELLANLSREEGERVRAHFRSEFDGGGVLYVGMVDGRVVTRMWLRHGRSISRWFINLEPNDYVLYAMYTHPASRGQGLIRALVWQSLEDERPHGGIAYVDCKVWNAPSLRAIDAMGFERIATMPPLSKAAPVLHTVYRRKGRLRRLAYVTGSTAFWLITAGGRLAAARGGVVLCYHGVADHEAEAFARQMKGIAKRTIAPSALAEPWRAKLSKSRVCVTFDDAYANLLTNALPVMRNLGITATIFVPTGNLGRCPGWTMRPGHPDRGERIMTEAELVQAVRDGGVRIGSHTVSHARLSELSTAELERELCSSKDYLENLLGRPVEMLALPYGGGSQQVFEIARQVGYTRVFTLDKRVVKPVASLGVLGRFLVDPAMHPWEFRLTSEGAYQWLGGLSVDGNWTEKASAS